MPDAPPLDAVLDPGSFGFDEDALGGFDIPFDTGIVEEFHRLAVTGYGPRPASIKAQLISYLSDGLDPVEAVGQLQLLPEDIDYREYDSLSRGLSGIEALRLYLWRELTDKPDYRIASLIGYSKYQRMLSVSDSVSEKTFTKVANEIDANIGPDIRPQLRSVARAFRDEELADDLLDLPDAEADGTGIPPEVELTREMRHVIYGPLRLERDQKRTTYAKWELLKPYELAANANIHLNDAHDSLRRKPYYYSRDPPTDQALWNLIRDYSREELRAMFLAAYEQFIDIIDDHGHLPERPDLAIDLTDWPWRGVIDDENRPVGVSGTKPTRNYSYSFKMGSISLINCEVPLTVGLQAVWYRRRQYLAVDDLLSYARARVNPGFVCLDKDFYSENVVNVLDDHGVDFIIGSSRKMDRFNHLITGTQNREENWNSCPWEVNVDSGAPDREKAHYLLVTPSEKRIEHSDAGLEDYSNWEAYYTNVDPETFEGGGEALAQRYRLRWGIETAYRQLKHEFLPKSASRIQKKREFLAMLGIAYNNAWLATNVKLAAREGEPVKDDQGRYHMTANQFMTAMLDDFAPIDIGELTDLSVRSKMVRDGLNGE